MSMKFNERKNAEVFYFISNNESTLPSRKIIRDKIQQCIPAGFDKEREEARHESLLWGDTKIYYYVELVDPNRYRITLYYTFKDGPIYALVGFLGLFIGYVLFQNWIGTIVGFAVAFILFYPFMKETMTRGEKICNNIVQGIKEYERAHLLDIASKP